MCVNFCYFVSDTVRSEGGERDSIAKQRQQWGPSIAKLSTCSKRTKNFGCFSHVEEGSNLV